MRNAIQRRNHKERAQPHERRRLGLLEKHKDYSKRAADYNKKKAKLKALREKASERNEDEFYFGMMSRRGPSSKLMVGKGWTGRVLKKEEKPLDMDAVRLLKTQDIGYVRTVRQVAAKEVTKLEERIIMVKGFNHLDDEDDEDDDDDFDLPPGVKSNKAPRKIVFMDEEDEREAAIEDQMDQDEAREEDDENSEEARAGRAEALEELEKRLEHAKRKVRTLTKVEKDMEIEQAKTAKTATSGGTDRTGKKLKVRTRKR